MNQLSDKHDSISLLNNDISSNDEKVPLLGINTTDSDAESFNIGEALSNHDSILQYSIKIAMYWLVIDSAYIFFYFARWYLWLLFSRYLGEHNNNTIAWSLNGLFVIQGCSILFWAAMADKYSYDSIALISCLLTFIGLALESLTPNFEIFLIGSIITASFRALNALTMGTITKYLPSYYAIKFMSYRYSIVSAATLLGPVIGGLITYLINIRCTFVFSAIISFISLLIMIIKVNKTQKQLIYKQLNIKYLYDYIKEHNLLNDEYKYKEYKNELLSLSDEHYQFPINTETYKSQEIQSSTKRYYEWYMTIMITLSNGCLYGTNGVLSTFYVIFCLDLFNISTVISTLHIAIFSLFYILSCLLVPKIVNKYKFQNKNKLVFEYIITVIAHILVISILFLYKPILISIGPMSLWYLNGLTGFLNGFTNMSQEIILLAIQPKKHAVKIAGFKCFMRNSAKGIACFFVELYWQNDHYWLIYGQIILYSCSLILIIGMIISEFLYRNISKKPH